MYDEKSIFSMPATDATEATDAADAVFKTSGSPATEATDAADACDGHVIGSPFASKAKMVPRDESDARLERDILASLVTNIEPPDAIDAEDATDACDA